MRDELEDLLDELINEKPQKKSEVSSFKPAPIPKEEKRKPRKDLEYCTVENKAICRCCHTELEPGQKHWLYDDWIEQYWWCVTCAFEQCNMTPPENNDGNT